MYHSITFGDKNTYDDWHLVATERPCVVSAQPKTRYIDIPGANGSIDLTDALAGRASLSNREGSFEFYVLNDYSGYNWVRVYREVSNYLHGRKMRMTLEDDPNYYYEGRFSVNQWKSQKDWSRIVIDYNVEPNKYWQGSGAEPVPVTPQGTGLTKALERRRALMSYHSIVFGDMNSYDDWHLVATERPAVAFPKPKTKYYDAPGADGQLDLTDVLSIDPVYDNREGSFEFYVLNDYPGYDWVTVHDTITHYLHGKKLRMTLEDDPDFFYEGRFAVNEWKTQRDWSRLVINYNLLPFKRRIGLVTEPILDHTTDPILDNQLDFIYYTAFEPKDLEDLF